MSILIKGMQMPKECLDCPMCDINDDCVLQEDKRFGTWEEQKKDCPLVEIPEPHGDLIDRDALEADICPDWNGLYVPDNAYSEKLIRNAPTVIEGSDNHADD